MATTAPHASGAPYIRRYRDSTTNNIFIVLMKMMISELRLSGWPKLSFSDQ